MVENYLWTESFGRVSFLALISSPFGFFSIQSHKSPNQRTWLGDGMAQVTVPDAVMKLELGSAIVEYSRRDSCGYSSLNFRRLRQFVGSSMSLEWRTVVRGSAAMLWRVSASAKGGGCLRWPEVPVDSVLVVSLIRCSNFPPMFFFFFVALCSSIISSLLWFCLLVPLSDLELSFVAF